MDILWVRSGGNRTGNDMGGGGGFWRRQIRKETHGWWKEGMSVCVGPVW